MTTPRRLFQLFALIVLAGAPAAAATPSPKLPAALTHELDRLKAHGHEDIAKEVLDRIHELASRESPRTKSARIAVGRVDVGPDADPRDVQFQAEVLEDGWFVTRINPPPGTLSFSAEGFFPKQLQIEGGPPSRDVLYLGVVQMKPVSRGELSHLRGRLQPEPGLAMPELTIKLALPPVNSPSNGYQPRSRWPEKHSLVVQPDGSFDVSGLTPTTYELDAQCEGCVKATQPVVLSAGKTADLVVPIERAREAKIEYVVGAQPPLSGPTQETVIHPGDLFKAAPDSMPKYSYTFQVRQRGGHLFGWLFYQPATVYQLPPNTPLTGEPAEKLRGGARQKSEFPIENGVYALESGAFHHWVVFRIAIDGGKPASTPPAGK